MRGGPRFIGGMTLPEHTLYDPRFEHDACGTGFVARVNGTPSHEILSWALQAVTNLTHRGAVDADARTGDGAGILTPIPYPLFRRELARRGHTLADPDDLAVAVLFLPRKNPDANAAARALFESAVADEGLHLWGWREAPIRPEVLGDKALSTLPDIQHVMIGRRAGTTVAMYERSLYLARKAFERRIEERELPDCYVPSMSSRTIVYKGLFVAPQLRGFYRDLRDVDYEVNLAVFHQRYSTNTFPNWQLAQPFRLIAHNGEINTVQGNRNWMTAREPELQSPVWGERISELFPIVTPRGSDSSALDNALELLTQSGRDIRHAMSMLMPHAWENTHDIDRARRGFYAYHSCLTEPWDGPAAIAFTDGTVVGATLDRNGLRPSRYLVSRGGLVVAGSEVGMIEAEELADDNIAEKGRLGPGQMIAVDVVRNEILKNQQVKREIASRQPYLQWTDQHLVRLKASKKPATPEVSEELEASHPVSPDVSLQRLFGYTREDTLYVFPPMSSEAKEPTFSMGDDTPITPLNTQERSFYSYFRQRFAQVTNPPIDSLREHAVMALDTFIGARPSYLVETPEHAHLVHLPSPVLTGAELEELRTLTDPAFRSVTLNTLFDVATPNSLEQGLTELCQQAERAVRDGNTILILSDREADANRAPIPMALAVSAVHHALIHAGVRMRADLVVETGEAWDTHHFAVLLGYGAAAIHPYLAFGLARSLGGTRKFEELEPETAEANYRKALNTGLLKIISKMGISTVSSYRGAHIFEAVGLSNTVVDKYLTGTPSLIDGVGLSEIEHDVRVRHTDAFGSVPLKAIPDTGYVRFRRDGESHAYSPTAVRAIQKAAREGDRDAYKEAVAVFDAQPPASLRDLLRFKSNQPAIPLSAVEPMEGIRHRFISSAMSLGALSPEAYTTLSRAMAMMGARSNSGEGGEDPAWYYINDGGPARHSGIKQVASARFGVTAEYLSRAPEIEIKIAQGSKPGEGGQLPSHKVTAMIARLRHAVPGIPLISPPPHHDIYSIEDLAQLIYDLKQANPRARVGVKLVSEAGVGTIAAGVTKAYADYILISGYNGGTGSSPLTSIKYAGSPWEIGLAETQQVLVLNDLRGRVTLRTDGGLRTGRDIVVAAMLGAEEYGFGTLAVVTMGCDMARQCHLNTCPTGIATQREDLRAKFAGSPEDVITYFTFVAEDIREHLASLGFSKLDNIVGRSDLLYQRTDVPSERAALLNLSRIITPIDPSHTRPTIHKQDRNDREDVPLDDTILRDVEAALDGEGKVERVYRIRNSHRAVGAKVAGEIARRYGANGLPEGSVDCTFQGSAGQSFGAFCTHGMRWRLIGQANDYVGKGMSGGEIMIRPPDNARFAWHENVIAGNTILYGATSGALYIAGRVGERFAVRNSGARAVVEGVGVHGCEYMTGGIVAILGPVGRTFAAGMSAGIAFVFDPSTDFESKVNRELVGIQRVQDDDDAEILRELVQEHVDFTSSPRGNELLRHWSDYLRHFWRVTPHPYAELLASGAADISHAAAASRRPSSR